MLEAFGQQENFFGRDPMRWWIGQVTDPDKGKWGDSLEKKRAEDNEDIYAFRCRVRIVGYHGSDSDLKDEELPLAHVLLPSNTTTVGGCGATLQYQGGEVVVGFFADGDDAQQPIIFGTLFKQSYIPDKKTNQKFNASPFTDFEPYTPPKVVQRSGKSRFNDQEWIPQSPPIRAFSDGESVKVAAQKQKEASTNISVDSFSPCEDNEISKISSTIKSFTRKLQTLQELNEGATYIDPVFGGTVDLQQEIKQTTNRVHDSMTKLVRRGRSWLVQDTLDKLSSTLKDKTPKTLQAPVGQATKSLSDVIFCNLEKIQEGLKDYLSKSFENMIGQVLDVPACGIENFLGDMFGQIDNAIDSGLGSMFEQLNNINGGGLAIPSDAFKKGIRFANIITNVLDCDSLNCPEPTAFSAKNGVAKAVEDSFEGILANSGLSQLNNLAEDIENIGNAIPASPTRPDCNTNVLECGPPRVDFIGGGGQGASGSAIVNALGNVIGVAINGTGFGFKEPPLLSFFDSCDKGYGAGGHPVMGNVSKIEDPTNVGINQIGGVVVTSNGLTVNAGGVGGIPVSPALSVNNLPIVAGGLGGIPVTAGGFGGDKLSLGDLNAVVNGIGGQKLTAGGFPVVVGDNIDITLGGVVSTLDGTPLVDENGELIGDVLGDGTGLESGIYIPDANGNSLGVVGAVITSPGQEYLSNTTEEDSDGNVKEIIPDPNASYDGESSYVSELGSVEVASAGFAYEDGDTVTFEDGSVGGKSGLGEGTGATPIDTTAEGSQVPTVNKSGQATGKLKVENGRIIGVDITDTGFGFTALPDLTINTETGFGAQLIPVLKFKKVEDASQVANTTQQSVISVIDCIHK
tara:strand:- start:1533 stop:4094 length:2562 start_codon:yes stop_codon:yes gene_type:complete